MRPGLSLDAGGPMSAIQRFSEGLHCQHHGDSTADEGRYGVVETASGSDPPDRLSWSRLSYCLRSVVSPRDQQTLLLVPFCRGCFVINLLPQGIELWYEPHRTLPLSAKTPAAQHSVPHRPGISAADRQSTHPPDSRTRPGAALEPGRARGSLALQRDACLGVKPAMGQCRNARQRRNYNRYP